MDKTSTPGSWLATFSEREQRCIDHARLYAAVYDHGEPGHLHLSIISRLAALLDAHDGIETHYAITRTLEDA